VDPVMDLETVNNTGYLILIFLGIGIVVYIGYEVYVLGSSAATALSNLWNDITNIIPVGSTPDAAQPDVTGSATYGADSGYAAPGYGP